MPHDMSDLPPEIIENFLSRLPAKSLLRFKTVSKSWNTMISDPLFVQHHIRQSKYSNPDNLFLFSGSISLTFRRQYVLLVKFEDRKFQPLEEIEYCTDRFEDFVCFCEEGVILLTDRTCTRFTLWNPSTRKQTKLVYPYCRPDGDISSFGLCRNPITDDFKVVIVDWDECSVYSCKNKSWVFVHKPFQYGLGLLTPLTPDNPRGVCIEGASYWVWSGKNVSEIILYFDPRNDKLKVLQKPENIVVDGGKKIYLVELRGSLCLYCNGKDEETIEIWTKENGIDNHSWKKLITVENVNMTICEFRPLCFVGNNIIVRKSGRVRFVVYVSSEKRFEEFEQDKFMWLIAPVPIRYIDSLFFPVEKPRPKRKKRK